MPRTKLLRRSNREMPVNLIQRRCWFEDAPAATTTTPTQSTTTPAPETQPDKTGDKRAYTQAELDAMFADRAKRAEESERARLLKELGVENLDAAKASIRAKQDADEAAKTEAQKLADKAAAAEKKAQEADAARLKIEQDRLVEKRDAAIIKALTTAKAKEADNILILMNAKKPALITAVLKADGVIDEKAIAALVEEAKKDHKSSFVGTGPGIPSSAGGRNPSETDEDKTARDRHWAKYRRY